MDTDHTMYYAFPPELSLRCTAWHELLKKDRTVDLKLVVEAPKEVTSSEPPKFLYSSEAESDRNTIILDEEEDLQLDCVASGIPLPSITWVVTYEFGNGDESHINPNVHEFHY
jgi:hypothetical protein